MILVFIYLLAVVLANILILWLGPQAAVITAFLFIGLDLSLRDKLHWDALPIALASATAFLAAGVGDGLVYAGLRKKRFMIRANGSNVAGSAIDSIVFPTLAFGVFMPEIVIGQFVAKFVGGFLWSLVLQKYFSKDEEEVQSA